MANLQTAGSFWKTMKSVSVPEIARESLANFDLAIVGDERDRLIGMAKLFQNAGPLTEAPSDPNFHQFDRLTNRAIPRDAGKDFFLFNASSSTEVTMTDGVVYYVNELGGWHEAFERLLDQRPDLWLSLGRRFPGLRASVSDRIIKQVSIANSEFAMLNALPGVVPIIAPLLPVAAVGDIFMLTKNQAMMLFRLSATHDLPLDLRARSRDLAPLLGNAFGWRAIARELVGIIPGGIGLVARGAIAYAGTYAIGKALQKLYETGEKPTRSQISQLYKQAMIGAKEIASTRLRAIRGRKAKELTRT